MMVYCIVRNDSGKKPTVYSKPVFKQIKGILKPQRHLLYFTIKWRYKGDEKVFFTVVVIQVGICSCLLIDIKIAVCK